MAKAKADPTTTSVVYPHPRAREGRARQLRLLRQLPHRERLEARLRAFLWRLDKLQQETIARLDLLQGDTDLELTCEDEGAACDDEGFDDHADADDSDYEPDAPDAFPEYISDHDQTAYADPRISSIPDAGC